MNSNDTSIEPDQGSTARVLVVAAMPRESVGVRRRLVDVTRLVWAGGPIWRGRFPFAAPKGVDPEVVSGAEVWVAHCGIGRSNAEQFCRRVAATGSRFDLGLVVGLAGGLDPRLASGELVEVTRVMDGRSELAEFPLSRCAPGRLPENQRREPVTRRTQGTLVTAESLLLEAESKKSLWESAGKPDCAVVDMETHSLCAGLESSVQLMRSARVVSDAADEALPACLARMVEDGGKVPLLGLLGAAIRDVGVLTQLVLLRRRMLDGAEGLGQWVEEQVVGSLH